jgi:hypothetical protein
VGQACGAAKLYKLYTVLEWCGEVASCGERAEIDRVKERALEVEAEDGRLLGCRKVRLAITCV